MSTDKKTIFISYGRDKKNPEDLEFIKKIKADLEKDFTVYMDIFRLRSGIDWANQLAEDIKNSDWMLFFITPYSARPTGFCHNELVYALSNMTSIASVMLREAEPPLSICNIQYLELQDSWVNESLYKQRFQELTSVLRGEKKQGFSGANASLYALLDPNKSKTIIADHLHGFVGRKWIYNKVDKWLTKEKDSRVLWITAEAGYGKTALAVYLSETHPSSTSIHFCQYDYKESKDPSYMLRILIYELSTQIEAYSKVLLGIDIEDKLRGTPVHIFTELLLEPLLTIETPSKDLFFIIDALDEAQDENGNNFIVDLISKRFSALPKWLNIVITSRPEPELRRKLKVFNPIELKADEENNLEDLTEFITINYPSMKDLQTTALVQKSEGNILYLKNILSLDIIKNADFTIEDIENLPEGMEGFYLEYFERKFDDIDNYEKELLDFVNIMVAFNDELSVSLIIYILEISERSFNILKDKFGSLLEENNGILTFYHKSIFDWLSDYNLSGRYSADIDQGNKLIVKRLWDLYKIKENNELINFGPYLLQLLYETKSFEKLNEILKDILFIGQMYNEKKHMNYKKILSQTIKNYSTECDSENLKIYEDFFKDKEYQILKINNEYWKPHQTLFQLAYEDGDNSPLSEYMDIFLEKNIIDFPWFRNISRNQHYIRNGADEILECDSYANLTDNKILLHGNGKISLLNLDTNEIKIFDNGEKISFIGMLNHLELIIINEGGEISIWDYDANITQKFIDKTEVLRGTRIIHGTGYISFYNENTNDNEDYIAPKISMMSNGNILITNYKDEMSIWDKDGILLDKEYKLPRHENVQSSKVFKLDNDNYLIGIHEDDTFIEYVIDESSNLLFTRINELFLDDFEFSNGYILSPGLTLSEAFKDFFSDVKKQEETTDTLRLLSNDRIMLHNFNNFNEKIDSVLIMKNHSFLVYTKNGKVFMGNIYNDKLDIYDGSYDHVLNQKNTRYIQVSNNLDTDQLYIYDGRYDGELDEFLKKRFIQDNIKDDIQEIIFKRQISYISKFASQQYKQKNVNHPLSEKMKNIVNSIKLSNGMFIGASDKYEIYLCDQNYKIINILSGHTNDIYKIFELNNDKILSFSTDNTARIWDIYKDNTFKNIQVNNEYSIAAFMPLDNANILFCDEDDTTYFLSENGEILNSFNFERPKPIIKTHIYSMQNRIPATLNLSHRKNGLYLELSSGEILIKLSPAVFGLFNARGEKIYIFEGHTGGINQFFELKNGNILTYSFTDESIIVWSIKGKLLKRYFRRGKTKEEKFRLFKIIRFLNNQNLNRTESTDMGMFKYEWKLNDNYKLVKTDMNKFDIVKNNNQELSFYLAGHDFSIQYAMFDKKFVVLKENLFSHYNLENSDIL